MTISIKGFIALHYAEYHFLFTAILSDVILSIVGPILQLLTFLSATTKRYSLLNIPRNSQFQTGLILGDQIKGLRSYFKWDHMKQIRLYNKTFCAVINMKMK
jgi:hypothetical protein